MIKSGLLELSQFTKSPALIIPKFIITSLEVKIILAFICASSLLFNFYKIKRQIPFAISAKIETIIIVEKSGSFSSPKNRLKTSANPIIASVILEYPASFAIRFFFISVPPTANKLRPYTKLSASISKLSATSPIDFEISPVVISMMKKAKLIASTDQSSFFWLVFSLKFVCLVGSFGRDFLST
jgi:hypothetical protein